MNRISSSKIHYRQRWFCYFDLLGFKNLVLTGKAEQVISLYQDVLRNIQQKADPKKHLGISYSWFSDTFIIFSRGDSENEFTNIEQAGRLFFQKLILSNIPVRGALTHGKLYSQLEQNIFIGEALIDAYEYGEKQNWLGFILTPKVYERLSNTPLNLENRTHYRRVVNSCIIGHQNSSNVFAFAFNNGSVSGVNPYLQAISEMKKNAAHEYHQKYTNTAAFILEHQTLNKTHLP